MSLSESMTIEELIEEFEFLDDWDDQCDYLIDLGFELPKLPEEARTEENRVHGCQSTVWLVSEVRPSDPPIVEFMANSDAIIVNGLIAVLTILYSGQTAQEVLGIDAKAVFTKLGMERHLSSQRRNGLYGMVERIRAIAANAIS
ncbi:MAG: SufE family protein [Pirellulaceae bacterium]